MKHLRNLFFSSIIVFLSLAPLAAWSAETTGQSFGNLKYTLMEGFAGTAAGQQAPGFVEYAKTLYTWSFRTAIIVAVVMLVYSGLQRVAAGVSESGISESKTRMWNVAEGLGWLFGGWLLLSTINPDLVSFNLNIPPLVGIDGPNLAGTNVGQGTGATTGGSTAGGTTAGGTTNTPTPSFGTTATGYGTQQQTLDQLKKGGITINRTNYCTQVGQTGCTTVANLGDRAVNGTINLKQTCNCDVMVTGGTDCPVGADGNCSSSGSSMHKTHRAGANVVDLAKTDSLNNFITSNPTAGETSSGYTQYQIGNATYVNEGDHWHVIY